MSQKHTSAQQFAALINFLKENKGLARGILIAPEYKSKAGELWDGITGVLNSIGPPIRTRDGWKKVWKDFKYHIKTKLRQNQKSIRGTGGGPMKQYVFSMLEEDVIVLLDLRTQESGLKVHKFGAAATNTKDGENIQFRDSVSPETRELILESERILSQEWNGKENEQPEEDEVQQEDVPVHVEKTPTRQTRNTTTSKKLLEQQVQQQKLYQEQSVQLLEQQNNLLEKQNRELKLQTEEMKKIRRIKEQKIKILKRRNDLMEKESMENRKLKLRELEIKKKKLELKELELQR